MDKILVNFREEINEKIASPISLSMLDKNLQELQMVVTKRSGRLLQPLAFRKLNRSAKPLLGNYWNNNLAHSLKCKKEPAG